MSTVNDNGIEGAGDTNSDANTPNTSGTPSHNTEARHAAAERLRAETEAWLYCARYGENLFLHTLTPRPQECVEACTVAEANGVAPSGHGTFLAVAPGRPGHWVVIADDTLNGTSDGIQRPYPTGCGGAFEVPDARLLVVVRKLAHGALYQLHCACNNRHQYDALRDAVDQFLGRVVILWVNRDDKAAAPQ